jgi:pimeloyl-ACP methyl ester carboxylesterase
LKTYPMPVYLGYILNSYTSYNQFTNPVSDLFNEPYASRLSSLYNGFLTSDQINNQLTTSVPGLITLDFLAGFAGSQKYASVRDALNTNSITGWQTNIPLLLIHGGKDTQVNPVSTENMYSEMIRAGTSPGLCKKVIIPDVDHGDGVAPCMIQGILFLQNLKATNSF